MNIKNVWKWFVAEDTDMTKKRDIKKETDSMNASRYDVMKKYASERMTTIFLGEENVELCFGNYDKEYDRFSIECITANFRFWLDCTVLDSEFYFVSYIDSGCYSRSYIGFKRLNFDGFKINSYSEDMLTTVISRTYQDVKLHFKNIQQAANILFSKDIWGIDVGVTLDNRYVPADLINLALQQCQQKHLEWIIQRGKE